MSWFTDANCEAESLKEHAEFIYAVDMAFPSGDVRLCTGLNPVTINGNSYTAVAGIASIDSKPSVASLTAQERTYSLVGVDPTVVPESEIDNSFRRIVTEYQVWLNPASKATIGFEVNWEGTISKVRRRDGGNPIIQVICEDRLAALERSDGWRYTPEHQAKFYAGDTGLDQIRGVESKEIIWGEKKVSPGSPGVPTHGNPNPGG